jgi:hypothetical protein
MKGQKMSFGKNVHPLLFCFGMFLIAMSFSVVMCFSTFYAFSSINSDSGNAKSATPVTGLVKNMIASVK